MNTDEPNDNRILRKCSVTVRQSNEVVLLSK